MSDNKNSHLAPGLKLPQPPPREDNKKVVNIKCRNKGCDSMTAEILEIPGNGHQRVYRCTECGHPIAVNVGGGVNF